MSGALESPNLTTPPEKLHKNKGSGRLISCLHHRGVASCDILLGKGSSQGCWHLVSHLQPPAWLGGGPRWGSPKVSGTKAGALNSVLLTRDQRDACLFLAFAVLLSLETFGSLMSHDVSPQIEIWLLIRKSQTCQCSEWEPLFLFPGKFCKFCCVPLQVAA